MILYLYTVNICKAAFTNLSHSVHSSAAATTLTSADKVIVWAGIHSKRDIQGFSISSRTAVYGVVFKVCITSAQMESDLTQQIVRDWSGNTWGWGHGATHSAAYLNWSDQDFAVFLWRSGVELSTFDLHFHAGKTPKSSLFLHTTSQLSTLPMHVCEVLRKSRLNRD